MIDYFDLDSKTKKLVDLLANPDSSETEIHSAIVDGGSTVQRYRDITGFPNLPVFEAIKHPNPKIVDLILKTIDSDTLDEMDRFFLFDKAATNEHIRLVLEGGITFPNPDGFGRTPLTEAYRRLSIDRLEGYRDLGFSLDSLKMSEIHSTLIFHTNEFEQILKENHDKIESKDVFHRTPILLAASLGFVREVALLDEEGASLNEVDSNGNGLVHLAALAKSSDVLQYLLATGFKGNERNSRYESPLELTVKCENHVNFELLLEHCRNNIDFFEQMGSARRIANNHTMIDKILSLDPERLSFDREEIWELIPSTRHSNGLHHVSNSDFKRGRMPRFGIRNPEEATEKFWIEMIRSRWSSYAAKKYFNINTTRTKSRENPVWSADRYGQSATFLKDGRIIEIGGEHEDGYDLDFYIYNDVFLHEPGKEPRIFVYPKEVFPPTDFHSATLMGNYIYIIGSLGYVKDRKVNLCPVYRLNLSSFEMEKVDCKGKDPGRIHRHYARPLDATRILVSGGLISLDGDDVGQPHEPAILDTKARMWLDVDTDSQALVKLQRRNLEPSPAVTLNRNFNPLGYLGMFFRSIFSKNRDGS